MILTLEVMGEQAEALGAGSRKVFDSIGGTIGRLPDNDWVFPDPYISGRHALIRFVNGKFFVEDTSTNGVFVNSPDNRISRAQAYQLKDGDLLYIDAYRIQVSIEQPAAAKRKADDPFELLKAHASGARDDKTVAMSPAEDDRTAAMARPGEDSAVEWFATTDMEGAPARQVAAPAPVAERPVQRAAPAPRSPSAALGRSPSAAGAGAQERPGAGAQERPPAPARASAKRTHATDDDDDLLREVIGAAGIEGVEPSMELAQTLGSVLRVAVGGVMDLLRARERMKDDMRLRGTTFKAQDNNPLKFSANVDDAFHNMLVKHNPAYLTPPDAFDDALRDVRDHQAAIFAALRLAFESMLAEFDPTRLQDDFDRQIKKGSIIGVPGKLRYWDLYRERYAEMVKDADASFRTLFGEEFAKAYEDQLEQLKALARNRPK